MKFERISTTVEWVVQFYLGRKWVGFGWPKNTGIEAKALELRAREQHGSKGCKFKYRIIRRTITDALPLTAENLQNRKTG